MEFPVLFLGQPARKVPALYSFMSYAAIMKGTWYPYGGFGKVVEALMKVAEDNGAHFYFNSPVEEIILSGKKVNGINVSGNLISFDAVVCAADYHFAEQYLLPEWARNYDERYWQKKKFAPSCLIFFIGLSKKIGRVEHHTLFFDEDAEQYSKELYEDASWPSRPLFYVSCPSRSDPTVAPYGHENLFFLMPISPGLADDELTRETYFLKMMERFEKHIGERVSSFVDFKLSYCVTDFSTDYNAYNGNAYGLANTLRQTAFMRPSMRNRKIRNLFYTGQLTVPGPGVPPTLISGKMAAGLVLKELKLKQHESAL
jgi:phytoene desaturase